MTQHFCSSLCNQENWKHMSCSWMFIEAVFLIAKKWQQMPINGWVDKQTMLYLYNEILFSH